MPQCETCKGSGEVTEGGTPKSVIEAKDGTRELWVGLLKRTKFKKCPKCSGGGKRRGRPRTVFS